MLGSFYVIGFLLSKGANVIWIFLSVVLAFIIDVKGEIFASAQLIKFGVVSRVSLLEANAALNSFGVCCWCISVG